MALEEVVNKERIKLRKSDFIPVIGALNYIHRNTCRQDYGGIYENIQTSLRLFGVLLPCNGIFFTTAQAIYEALK